ncbi:glycoside hydrolase family 88 [Pyrrhoderma noxium]|uniref:Glycoside hydrolase family 88 n=1 Tax=Pyrrhoderma noxium TaxID=2282107 RepID=A0A286UUN4_9AGAM|nr:glycoside hydrolase family 88 [Pyrrhoderma noxium]
MRFLLVSLLFSSSLSLAALPTGKLFSSLVQSKILEASNGDPSRYPQFTDQVEGIWQYFDANQWTSGFFPATLYEFHKRTLLCPSSSSKTDWLSLGRQWSESIAPLAFTANNLQHDVGFVSFPFQEELKISNQTNTTAIPVINGFANDLAARFSPIVGCTQSWDTADPTDFQVIIDNMMNLDLLFISAGLTQNDTLRQIAISHADHTIENHVRPDGSSFHVVEYNSTTGNVIRRRTAQGYADNSTWSRGQAWGIYGFATMYENTQLERYLDTSRRMATYFKNTLPEDGIVPWDFNAPLVPSPRPADSSAATIAATGLLLLSRIESNRKNSTGAKLWSDFAISLLDRITDLAWRPEWQSLLSNGTVNEPAGNELTGIVYGDYYYIKAGNDLVVMGLTKC